MECVVADFQDSTAATISHHGIDTEEIPSPLLLPESPCLLPTAGFLDFIFLA